MENANKEAPAPRINFTKTLLKGGGWTFGAQGINILLQFGSIIILARLLEPSDFGLIGMLGAVIAILGMFREFGLSTAIVQKKDVTNGELNRLFHVTIALGVVLFFATTGLGHAAAWFMGEPRLTGIAPWFGLCMLLGSLETIPSALLKRRLHFRQMAVRDVTARVISFVIAVSCAYNGFGYWSLVIQTVASSSLLLIMNWSAAAWWPSMRDVASFTQIKGYFGFGAAFTISNLATYLTQNIDGIIIGRIWGAESLGYYSRARMLMIKPTQQLLGPLSTILLPLLCRVKDDQARMRRIIAGIAPAFIYPPVICATWIAVGAADIVTILLGPGWSQTSPLLAWLSLSIIYMPVGSLLFMIILASGRPSLLMKWTWTGAVIVIAGFSIGAMFGMVWVAASFTVTGLFLRVPVAMYFTSRTGFISAHTLTRHYLFALLSAAVLLSILYPFNLLIIDTIGNPYARLLLLGMPGALLLTLAIAFHQPTKSFVSGQFARLRSA